MKLKGNNVFLIIIAEEIEYHFKRSEDLLFEISHLTTKYFCITFNPISCYMRTVTVDTPHPHESIGRRFLPDSIYHIK